MVVGDHPYSIWGVCSPTHQFLMGKECCLLEKPEGDWKANLSHTIDEILSTRSWMKQKFKEFWSEKEAGRNKEESSEG